MRPAAHTRADFEHSPMIVFYETTRACDLACKHCRADAHRNCDPNELSTAAAKRMIADLARFPKPPLLVLTGGDPIKRRDVFELIEFARLTGLDVAMTPSATPLVTRSVVRRLKEAGLHRLAVSLDGSDPATHDEFRQVRGSFARTLRIIDDARRISLPVQVKLHGGAAQHRAACADRRAAGGPRHRALVGFLHRPDRPGDGRAAAWRRGSRSSLRGVAPLVQAPRLPD
jgi:MoaA/NifB/PqqE/SkfB family radical SAM enzyme